MKLLRITVILLATVILPIAALHASDIGEGDNAKNFDKYLRNFDYDERKAMKIRVNDLLKLYKEGKVQIIDIRFQEEAAAWKMGFTTHIPLNELPDRLNELDKDIREVKNAVKAARDNGVSVGKDGTAGAESCCG